jgi:hypothetical protein
MNFAQHALLIFQTTIAMAIFPLALVVVNRLLIQSLDDRGMYLVPPFSWLHLLAGALLCSAALDAMEVTDRLNPEGFWLSDYWSLRIDELYDIWLNPFDILFAVIAGVIELRLEHDDWRVWILRIVFGLACVVALLAWRNWQAIRGVVLFFWLTLTAMILMYMSVITLAWITHWLNFWLLLVIFIFLYLFDKDGDQPPRSPL